MGKNILMVLEGNFPPDDRVYKEAKLLTKNGFSVTIASTSRAKNAFSETWEGICIERKYLPAFIYKSSIGSLKVPIYFNYWKRYLIEVFAKKKYDAIHIHDLPLAEVGVYFKNKFKIPLVLDLHENWPSYLSKAIHTNTFIGKILSSEKQWRNYEKLAVIKADKIITVVEEMKNRLMTFEPIDEKFIVLQNTLSPEEYDSRFEPKDPNHFTLIFAGAINVERGLQFVIPSIEILRRKIPSIRLQIIGTGSYKKSLERIVTNLNLSKHIEFIGWKPVKELVSLTAKADIALIPHLKWEQTDCSSPNKLFQYMQAGIPLLVSNCDSVARIVKETKTGEVYEYDNIHDFAAKVLQLFENESLRKEFGENGPFWVKEKYQWEKTSKEFLDMYQMLLN